jgi:hypothetical protein
MTWFGLGIGLVVGGGVVYAFYISEAMRLVTVGVGAFLLAALTIGGTALVVNRQWTKALGAQSHRTIHNHRYPTYGQPHPTTGEGFSPFQPQDLLPPLLPVIQGEHEPGRDLDDEIVA